MQASKTAIIGGGLCGNLLAICLAQRGHDVEVFERRSQPRSGTALGGRSINLALAERGIAALTRFDAMRHVEPLLLPVSGRMIHEPGEAPAFVPYGAHDECIYSVSRAALNFALYELAKEYGVEFRFDHICAEVDRDSGLPVVHHEDSHYLLEADAIFAADGAGSAIRRSLAASGLIQAEESLLEHGYKELTIAPRQAGDSNDEAEFALEAHALHIWPRSEYMLIALPNTDKSFTLTLFLSRENTPGFDNIDAGNVTEFFAEQFSDALPLIDDLEGDYARNAVGELGTVRCNQWHAGRCLLIGDAAHAVVPFHGQGMNAAFEDVRELDDLLAERDDESSDWLSLFSEFEARRIDNANAIADMALENYGEMRADVRDPQFLLRRELALELERRFPDEFISRYAMVMFHPEIPYKAAQDRGALQARMLAELTRGKTALHEIDMRDAAEMLAALPALDTR
jgi:kynurenine 3-monooxygenase